MTAIRYALILALVFLPASPFATTFPVTKTGDTNDGVCDADCSLREAVEAANTNPGADDVPVPAGNYLLTLGQLTVTDDVSIAGAGQTNTIIDGNASDRVFATSGVVEISGVTIQNGYAYGGGGGGIRSTGDLVLTNSMVSENTSLYPGPGGAPFGDGGGIHSFGALSITNSTVNGNTAGGNGGGILSIANPTTLTNSTVSDNTADNGSGGIAGSYMILTDSTVSGNSGSRAGGISCTSVTLTDSTVSGNSGGRVGGISCTSVTLTDSTVSGNSGSNAGGISCTSVMLTNSTVSGNSATIVCGGILGSSVTLTNSTVSGNTNTGYYYYAGGGIWGSSVTLTNSTVSGNTAYRAGGIFADRYATVTLTNTILAHNDGLYNCEAVTDGGFDSWGYNLTDDTSCAFTEPSDLVVADAMLSPLQGNGGPTETHDLLPGSPAIDAGSVDCPPPATDQRGVARPQGAGCDIGAVEFVPEPQGSVVLIAGAASLGLLYRRRAH
jgi:CSLREA domain-containing protein